MRKITRQAVAALAAVLMMASVAGAAVIITEPSDFALLAGGSLTTDVNVTVGGKIGSGGVLYLGTGTHIAGDVYTLSSFNTGQSATIDGRVLAAGEIYLNSYASAGGLEGRSSLSLAPNATVGGNVVGAAYVGLGAKATVQGHLSYGTSYWANATAHILGSAGQNTMTPDTWEGSFRTAPVFEVPSGSIYYAAGSDTTLAPGDYGTMSVAQGSVLRLSAGTYDVSSLWVGAGTQILVDTSAGNVVLNFGTGLSTSADVLFDATGAGSLVINARDYVYLGTNSYVDGSVYSYGSLDVAAGGSIYGQAYAATTAYLGSGASVMGVHSTTVVPEPATLVLMGLGAVSIVLSRRCKRR